MSAFRTPVMEMPTHGNCNNMILAAPSGSGKTETYRAFQNIKFYSEHTQGMPLFLENVGDVTLYAKTAVGTIKLDLGDRKEVRKENAEAETPSLPNGDLYPAGNYRINILEGRLWRPDDNDI